MGDRGLTPPCAPCRRGPPLAFIDPDAAINLHATRSASERQGDADLIGGEIAPTALVIDTRADKVVIWLAGLSGFSHPFGSAGSTDYRARCYNGAGTVIAQFSGFASAVHNFVTSFTLARPFGNLFLADGYWGFTFDIDTGDFSDNPLSEVVRCTVTHEASGAVLWELPDLQEFFSGYAEPAGARRARSCPIYCWPGPFSNTTNCPEVSINDTVLFRWRFREVIAGVAWEIAPSVGTIEAFSPSGSCALGTSYTLNYNDTGGTPRTVGVTGSWLLALQFSDADHHLCAGGKWPTSFPIAAWEPAWLYASPNPLVGFEPAEVTGISTWSISGLAIPPYPSPFLFEP